MKVAFDSRPAKDLRGIGRYARCLLAALREPGMGAGGGLGLGREGRGGLGVDEVVETRDPRGCDVFHSPWIEGALLHSPVPMVVTLHDLVPLKRRGEYLRSGLRFKLRYLAVQRASRVIVPTKAVADDAISALGIPAERLVVIPEAPAPVFWPRSEPEVAAVRQRYRLPERYLLWVGGLRTPDPRKRVAALARAERTLPLVLVGPTSPWAEELPGVLLTGAVDDEELAAIYTGAHALVFPSDDEGFGLPPIEALACGTPVAACEVPALREVLDGLIAFCAKDDLDGLLRTAESLQRPAPKPPRWTWGDAAAATWEVYAQALSAPRVGHGGRHLSFGRAGAWNPTGGLPRRD